MSYIISWPSPAAVTTGQWQCPANTISGLTHLLRLFCKKSYLKPAHMGQEPDCTQKNAKLWMASSSSTKWMLGAPPMCCWKILHCYFVWGVFFQRLCWHVTTPTFITCMWTFMKQRRIVTLLIGGNWIWFFIPSKHLFTDRINPTNCFKLCISLQPIMIVTKHVIRANEHNYQCLQIWGFRLFSQTFHMWPFYHWFAFKNRNKLY